MHLLELKIPNESIEQFQVQHVILNAPLVLIFLQEPCRCGPERAKFARAKEPGVAKLDLPSREALPGLPRADLTLSLDVIYHLVEDDVFVSAMRALFDKAARFVVIYASNQDADVTLAFPSLTIHVASD